MYSQFPSDSRVLLFKLPGNEQGKLSQGKKFCQGRWTCWLNLFLVCFSQSSADKTQINPSIFMFFLCPAAWYGQGYTLGALGELLEGLCSSLSSSQMIKWGLEFYECTYFEFLCSEHILEKVISGIGCSQPLYWAIILKLCCSYPIFQLWDLPGLFLLPGWSTSSRISTKCRNTFYI